jgi:hypothetical protein
MNKLNIYSVYAGDFYQINENQFDTLDDGQLPLIKLPKSCSKCYSRGHVGFSKTTYNFQLCTCVIKTLDRARLDTKFNIQSKGD